MVETILGTTTMAVAQRLCGHWFPVGRWRGQYLLGNTIRLAGGVDCLDMKVMRGARTIFESIMLAGRRRLLLKHQYTILRW
jgi:hypothetical protein